MKRLGSSIEDEPQSKRTSISEEPNEHSKPACSRNGSNESEDFINDKHSSTRAKRHWKRFSSNLKHFLTKDSHVFSDQLKRDLCFYQRSVTSNSSRELFTLELCVSDEFVLPNAMGAFRLKVAIPRYSIRQLLGFDNTGNIRMWPGSEALAYYVYTKIKSFEGMRVLELGAGCIGLPAFTAAFRGANVVVTDGNGDSVENLHVIATGNQTLFLYQPRVEKLTWGCHHCVQRELLSQFDVILAADCVFFKNSHTSLFETISQLLAVDGCVYMSSPARKGTLEAFTSLAPSYNFKYEEDVVFTQLVSERMKNVLDVFDDDVPHLGVLRRV